MKRSDVLTASTLCLGLVLATEQVRAEQSAALPSGKWVQVTKNAAFSPRDTAEDAVFDGKMWISNAYHAGGKLVRDLWCSSDGANWTLVTDKTPYDGYSEMVVHKDRLWTVKGSVWNSTDGRKWTRVLEKTPFGVPGYSELVVHDSKMWQLGSGADVWNTTDGVKWTCVTKQAPYGPRTASAIAAYKDKLWLMGGRITKASEPPEKHYKQFTTFNDVWSSSDGKHWTRVLEQTPWAPRMWFISKVYAERMWIIGGFDNRSSKNFGDVWYTADGKTWHEFVHVGEHNSFHRKCLQYKRSAPLL